MNKTVLLTGAAGYIGSHAVLSLLEQGYEVVALDNLSNSTAERIETICELTRKPLPFFKNDVGDIKALSSIFTRYSIDAVIHFAGLKSVSESIQNPNEYYKNNVAQSLTLFEEMQRHNVTKLIFSSSATVYDADCVAPVSESSPTGKTSNPYGATKYFLERILQDLAEANSQWSITSLRYFNPVGAHHSSKIGEDVTNDPTNLVPLVSQALLGMRDKLTVFGNDYDTKDGTGIRDFIHVMDLVEGHIAALGNTLKKPGFNVYNLGTGCGYSVLDVISTFQRVTGRTVPFEIGERRPGDIAISFADTHKAAAELNWKAQYSLDDMVKHHWTWCLNQYSNQ